MELILSPHITTLTGSLGKSYGYYIRCSGDRFFSQRKTKGFVPADGHLRFIFTCARLSHEGFFLSDILISGSELIDAAREAGVTLPPLSPDTTYHAHDVLNMQLNSK